MIARLDVLTEELSFGSVSAEREGSRKVFTCDLALTTPQIKFAKDRVIERVFRKALCVRNRSQFRQAALSTDTLPNCNLSTVSSADNLFVPSAHGYLWRTPARTEILSEIVHLMYDVCI